MGTKRKQTLGWGGKGTRTDGPGAPGTQRTPGGPTRRPGPRPNSSRTTKSGGANGARVPGNGAPNCERSWGPGTRGRARGAGGARGATHPSLAGPALAPAAAGARPGAGKGRGRRGPGRGRTARYLGSAPRRRLPGPARGVRPRRPLSPPRRAAPRRGPRTARAGPLELRSRPATGGLARGRRLPSRAPAPGTAAEPPSATREGPPEDGGRAQARAPPAGAAPLPQRRRRPGAVLLLPTCRKDTEHARAETTSG